MLVKTSSKLTKDNKNLHVGEDLFKVNKRQQKASCWWSCSGALICSVRKRFSSIRNNDLLENSDAQWFGGKSIKISPSLFFNIMLCACCLTSAFVSSEMQYHWLSLILNNQKSARSFSPSHPPNKNNSCLSTSMHIWWPPRMPGFILLSRPSIAINKMWHVKESSSIKERCSSSPTLTRTMVQS